MNDNKEKHFRNSIPSLDLKKIERSPPSSLSAHSSYSSDREREESDVALSTREVRDIIDREITFFREVKTQDENIKKKLEDIENYLKNLSQERDPPLLLSRCNAMVGNTQSIIGELVKMKTMIEDIEKDFDRRFLSMHVVMMSLNADLGIIQKMIRDLNDKIEKL